MLQWPAFAASVAAAWLVGSTNERRRFFGFWIFLVSNVLWIVWAWPDRAWALVALQIVLAAMNIRGLKKAKAAKPLDST
ncbi:MAG: hypothetical protein SH820_02450 [Xanthomonadales bacterium]|nr:hypothetical protein [Xanthomonadales bacterium]